MSKASWYSTGSDADEAVKDEVARQEAAREERSRNQIRRWWMRPTDEDDEKHLVFVDDEKHPDGYKLPFVFREHNIHLNGHWRNWFTCIEGLPGEDGKPQHCPLCRAENRPYLAAAYTVQNRDSYTVKDGSIRNADGTELNLFVCKTKVYKMIRKASKKKKGLRGWLVEVTRTSSDAPNTGDLFEFEEWNQLPKNVVPYDYMTLFMPKSEKELVDILAGGAAKEVEAQDDLIRF